MVTKRLTPKGAWPKATLLLVSLETLVALVLESLILREHILRGWRKPPAGNALSTPNIVYPILYLLGIICLFVLCLDAMLCQNQIQVVAFTLFNFLCFGYGIIQTIDDWQDEAVSTPLMAYTVALTVTMGVCSVFLLLAAWKLAAVFGWEMYRFLGADLRMRRMHKAYEILITLLKFDVFFFVAFAIQIFTLVDTTDKTVLATLNGHTFSRQQVFVGLGMPASVILLGLAFFGVMKENKIACMFVMVCLVAVEPYFIYQLVVIHLPANYYRFSNSMKYLTFFIIVTMLLVMVTLFTLGYCWRNFGKGLLISTKSKKLSMVKRPFEIDEDVAESVPSIPLEQHPGATDDGSKQSLMAYPALKKIQETYKDKPTSPNKHQGNNHYQHQQQRHENAYHDKMEIERTLNTFVRPTIDTRASPHDCQTSTTTTTAAATATATATLMSYSQFQEDYALNPSSRAELLQTLTPGTPEHSVYSVRLLLQQLQDPKVAISTKEFDKAVALVKELIDTGAYSYADVYQLRLGLAILGFDVKPELLLKELGFGQDAIASARSSSSTDVAPPQEEDDFEDLGQTDASESLPSGLDQNLIQLNTLTEKMIKSLMQSSYNSVPSNFWPHLLAQPEMEKILFEHWSPSDLDNVLRTMPKDMSPSSLEIVGKADSTQVDKILATVIVRLHAAGLIGFSENQEEFRHLTVDQLQYIKKQAPTVANDDGFVALLEMRIVPEPFPVSEDAAHKAWLDQMVLFVDGLPAKFNFIRLSVNLMSLELDLSKGIWDKKKFLRYVAIPRSHSHYNSKALSKFDANQVVSFNYPSYGQFSSRIIHATSKRDNEIVEEFLCHFMKESKSYAEFDAFFEINDFLAPLLARTMLTAGDKEVEKWSRLLHSSEGLTTLAQKTIIRFTPDNPAKFLPSDPVVFNLRAKNAKRILVRVFEIKTFEYLQQHGDNSDNEGLGMTLKLDGLTPNWEHHLALDKPSIEMHDVTIELTELASRRGAFVVDVISNGENCSAYFTKGCLDFVERQSVAGHVITVVDEQQQMLTDKTSIWLNGYYYKPNGDGDIIIPYRKTSTSTSGKIYLIHDSFATRRNFDHRVEVYSMKMACHVDNEAMVAGCTAKAVIKPIVQINGNATTVPVSLLEQVVLHIESVDTNHITTTSTVPDFKLHDVDWSEYTFQVPENLKSIEFTLTAKVKVIATGELQDLLTSQQFRFTSPVTDGNTVFEVNGQWHTAKHQGEIIALLQKRSDGHKLLIVGKNGEKRAHVPLHIQMSHHFSDDYISAYLRSDSTGLVHLGALRNITTLTCASTKQSWDLVGRTKTLYPELIHIVAGESISLPFHHQGDEYIRRMSLFSMTGDSAQGSSSMQVSILCCAVKDYTNHIKLEDGVLNISKLNAGYYVLRLPDGTTTIDITVAGAKTIRSTIPGLENYLIQSNPMMELSETTRHPLYMGTPKVDSARSAVEIQLYNWSAETRLCTVASKFMPSSPALSKLAVLEPDSPWSMMKTELTSTSFRAGRVLGDEYQYVLNRKANTIHWAGNFLTKPSVLLTPWAIASSTSNTRTVMAEENLCEAYTTSALHTSEDRDMRARRMAKMNYTSGANYDTIPLLTFLINPSVTLVNLRPDLETGLVKIPLSMLKENSFLDIVAIDGPQSLQQFFSTAGSHNEFQKRDLRFKTHIDYRKHYIAEKMGIKLDPTIAPSTEPASITLNSTGSSASSVRVINSVSQVYDLLLTLLASDDGKLEFRKFRFIVDWPRLSLESKKEKYSKWNCHELNLFLYKKDKDFFDSVVAPFLKNKLNKSFMDEYLIEAPLDRHTSMRAFRLLTCMEKCLLAQRVPSIRPAVIQWVRDRIPDIRAGTNAKLFNTVMSSGALNEVEEEEEDDDDEYESVSPAYSPTSPVMAKKKMKKRNTQSVVRKIVADTEDEVGEALAAPSVHGHRWFRKAIGAVSMGGALSIPQKAVGAAACFLTEEMRDISETIVSRQFTPLDLTKEMGETYYYNRRDVARTSTKDTNLFWLDYVHWVQSQSGAFLSQNFIVNTESLTDVMATLALLDVTFKPKEITLVRSADQNLLVTAQSPSIVFHSSTKELNEVPLTGTVLVTQQYYAQDEKNAYDEILKTEVRRYIQPNSEFKTLESYGAHVVLMNASSNPLKVYLQLQIPQGAISIYGSLDSSQDIQLRPHGSIQYEYGFYFPEQGDFPHYPAHVSTHDSIVAFAQPALLRVRTPESNRLEANTSSWSYILKSGSKEDILQKLDTSSLTNNFPVSLLLPRLSKDVGFVLQVISTLRKRQEYHDEIWRQALVIAHHDVDLVREYLDHQENIITCLPDWFTSKYLVIRPQSRLRNDYDDSIQYLEYFPLVNSRAHKANRDATISNDKFKDQYRKFLNLLISKPRHDAGDLLMLVVYLLAQDRIKEAKAKFAELAALVSAKATNEEEDTFQRLQYDYLQAYLSLCVQVHGSGIAPVTTSSGSASILSGTSSNRTTNGAKLALDLEGVQRIVEKYKNHPVERWNRLFKDMKTYVDEIVRSDKNETDAAATAVAASMAHDGTPSSFSVISSSGATDASSSGTESALLPMDIEDEEDDQRDVPVMVDFKIGSDSVISVRHRGIREVTVEYYSIDAETMFSSSPLTFSDQGENEDSGSSSSFSSSGEDASTNSYRLVKPNGVDAHNVKRAVVNDGILMIPILPQYLNTNVMLSVSTVPPAATKSWKAYYSQTVQVQTLEQTGSIKVISKTEGGRPIRGGYVKVYAEMKQGVKNTSFWKDGYTDLVGRFAYAHVSCGAENGGNLSDVKRFVVFVDGGREGCVVKVVPVPPV
ncbi:hypothetical protein BG004_007317 [Podila humilis]|nr:hypothetical protein BG004_007317 [Podila humilis]